MFFGKTFLFEVIDNQYGIYMLKMLFLLVFLRKSHYQIRNKNFLFCDYFIQFGFFLMSSKK